MGEGTVVVHGDGGGDSGGAWGWERGQWWLMGMGEGTAVAHGDGGARGQWWRMGMGEGTAVAHGDGRGQWYAWGSGMGDPGGDSGGTHSPGLCNIISVFRPCIIHSMHLHIVLVHRQIA